MKALVIDDSRAVRRLVGGILTDLGYQVTEAIHGLDGLEKLDSQGIQDIVLVDWNMPEMNGIDFVKAVRKNPDYHNMPIMMVTTETEMDRMALAFLAGVDEYVMKPFDKATILQKLELLGIGVA
jgi:two-component system, chemotaxis family, chemotaxis protein CheY